MDKRIKKRVENIDIFNFDKFLNNVNLVQYNEVLNIVEDIFQALPNKAVYELYKGSLNDLDILYRNVVEVVANVLFYKDYDVQKRIGYVENFSNWVEEYLSYSDLIFFITKYIDNFIINWHHIEWGELVNLGRKRLVIAARDHGKSYFWSNAFLIWKLFNYSNPIYKQNKKQLFRRGFLFSFSQQQANDLLEILKQTIKENDKLYNILYPKNSDNWGKQDIVCENGARLTVKGLGASIRGAHPGYIVVDDALKDNVIYSKTQREKSISYFNSVIMNMLIPMGDITVVGTPMHEADLLGHIKKNRDIWIVREYPAIFPNGLILWRERWNFEDLMEKRKVQGNIVFSRENLVKPISNDSAIFTDNIIKRAIKGMENIDYINHIASTIMKFDYIVAGIDFAKSANIGADYMVIITAGVKNGVIYLLNIIRSKGKRFSEQMKIIESAYNRFNHDLIYMENNVFQQIYVETAEELLLPVEGHMTNKNKYDLKFGIPSLVVYFEQERIKIPYGKESVDISDTLISELKSIGWNDDKLEGIGEHDDMVLALWLTVLAAKRLGGRMLNFDFV